MNETDLKDRLAVLAEKKATLARATKAKTEAERDMKAYQADLWQDMEEAGFRSFGHDMGTFSRKSTDYATITDREAFLAWCEENGVVEDYVQQREVDGRLNELVRSRLDSGEELPPGVDFYTRRYISLTK